MIILCIGDAEANLALAKRIRHAFPQLQILARAAGRLAAYEMLELGVEHVYRESLDGALRLGADALRLLGRRAHSSWRLAQAFRRRDEANLRRLAPVFRDRQAHLSQAREAIRDLEASLQNDAELGRGTDDAAWDAESLRKEFGMRAPEPRGVIPSDD